MEIRKVTVATVLFEWPMQQADLLSKIITGIKSWVFTYKPEVKHQSLEWCTNT
jgi:hypothetical protein